MKKNKRLLVIATAVPLLLIIPLIAMRFTDEVNWSTFDFIVMGILLLGTSLGIELVLRNVQKIEQRAILIVATLAAFLLLWAELAVGIFNTPFAGN